MEQEFPKFWSDDFDMDLLNLWPDLPLVLGETINVPVWTIGHETYGRLNHPIVWNAPCSADQIDDYGYGPVFAAFWLAKPLIARDKNGWACIPGTSYVFDSPLIECIWLEVLRDAWVHTYRVQFGSEVIWDSWETFGEFQRIMFALRDNQLGAVPIEMQRCYQDILAANKRFAHFVRRHTA